ncbi:MAG: formate dehydrogenase accessory protein FdhE [Eggerthellaceae bacterium]|jgi:FdhE protein
MDLTQIASAVEEYGKASSEADRARLDFFAGLYRREQEHAERMAAATPYTAPDGDAIEGWYWAEEPVLGHAPATVDASAFADAARDLSAWTADHAGLVPDAAQALASFDWNAFAKRADLDRAGAEPPAFLEAVLDDPEACGVPGALPVPVFAAVLTGTLRSLLQPASEAIMAQAPKGSADHNRPLRCPVCGMPAAASTVGDTPDSEGKGRRQYCSLCGARWSFERIRCGNCGTRNQGHLHYHHVEGDPAHRLQTCDECGGYQRVVFQDELIASPCMEVEDVVMARLDQIALDPRFGERVNAEAGS